MASASLHKKLILSAAEGMTSFLNHLLPDQGEKKEGKQAAEAFFRSLANVGKRP